MSGPKTTRGPAGGAAGTSLSASEATVQSAYREFASMGKINGCNAGQTNVAVDCLYAGESK